MKQFTIYSLILIWSTLSFGQITIENFDRADTTFEENVEAGPSYINFTNEATDFVEGDGALRVKYSIGAFHPWGSFGNALFRLGDGEELWDWSLSDSLSIWIKVTEAPMQPEYMVFRMHLVDRPTEDVDIEEYIYENTILIDELTEWIELKIPLIERETDGSTVPNNEGFVLVPKNWGGGTYNNEKFDRDKIFGYNLSAVTTGWTDPDNIPADSVEVLYDNFTRFGYRALPFIFFNGIAFNSTFTAYPWGQSVYSIEEGAGAIEGTNAVKWVQGDEWANGWTGVVFETSKPMNMVGSFLVDSLKFKMKAESGTGDIRMQFESGDDGKMGSVFTPNDDGEWHDYSLALSDMTIQDDAANFKPDSVIKIGFMAEGNAVVGKVIYLDDWWTGNPIFDVIPPAAPTQVAAIQGSYQNLVTWVDVPNEDGAVYNVLYSMNPITSTDDEGLEVVATGVPQGEQIATHVLMAPIVDTDLTYYYAVYCLDAAGNESPVVGTDAVTNTAKGVTTIHPEAPANFIADGNLSEWTSIPKFRIFPSDGSGTVVNNTIIDGDADLSVNAYVAMDDDFIYVAYDIEDDIMVEDTTIDSWLQDAPDLFIGLYDWHGKSHTSYQKSNEPDIHVRFNSNKIIVDNWGGRVLARNNTENYTRKAKFPTGYTVEAKISLDSLAADDDVDRFHPVVGMRIPIDFSINDADATGEREGILTYSINNQDKAHSDVSVWTYTWIGDEMVGVADKDLSVNTYGLSQNYPNPFNPSTVINYSLANSGMVSLKIYNVLGQEVLTLVNTNQNVGQYQVKFDASHLSSGLYIYRIQSGNFVDSKKMMLLK